MGFGLSMRLEDVARPARPVLAAFAMGLVLLGVSRLGLAGWQAEAVARAHGWTRVLVQGVRVDVATLCLLFGLPAVAVTLWPGSRALRIAVMAWLAACLALLAFLELATPGFMGEFGLRPNRQFLEYLVYPREVFSTLWHGRPLQLVLLPVASAGVLLGAWHLLRRVDAVPHAVAPWPLRIVFASLLLGLAALGARSSLGHRPLNPAMVAPAT